MKIETVLNLIVVCVLCIFMILIVSDYHNLKNEKCNVESKPQQVFVYGKMRNCDE